MAQEAEDLELQRQAIAKQKEHYGKGLKKIAELEEKTKEQAKIIEAQKLEIERLQPKQTLTRKPPGYAMSP